MRRWLVLPVLALCVGVCGCKSVSKASPDRERRADERREKATQDMMRMPSGEESPFGS
jgi:hypothetical protein